MSTDMSTVVIVGAGQAGGETALALRQQGYAGRIVLIGEETHPPYRRPPLSKTYLNGELAAAALLLRSEEAYATAGIELMLGRQVEAIARNDRTVICKDGATLHYDHLVLATGGQVRKLALPGSDAPNVYYLRTIADARRLREALAPGRRVVVVGGGYVGLEVAASAAKAGAQVTVLEGASRLLARVAGAELSVFFETLHRAHGVDIQTGVAVSGFEFKDGKVVSVLAGGRAFTADCVIVGIGLIPGTALAENAGLEVSDGIVVDEFARTGDERIYAVGDCARHFHPALGRSVRLESVPSASEMAKAAASAIVGKPKPISAVPWFWSDQFGIKLQMAGMPEGHDAFVERRAPGSAAFSLCYLREGQLIAVASVNAPLDFQAARELIARKLPVNALTLADTATPLRNAL
ncbi:MAG: FAD-dependent oxidoreductase [Pseudomonadota bacterium]